MDVASIIILICIFFLLYGYFFYPFTLQLFSKLYGKKPEKLNTYEPDITIIISAYNEESLIKDAVLSVMNSDYPNEKITLLVGSDGSNDKTETILSELKHSYQSLELYSFQRIGKNAVINKLIELVKTDVVFFMDADIRIDNGTIQSLLSYLSDTNVGAVISNMVSIGDDSSSAGGFGEILYQKIERKFRINESSISSTVNALGAFYGVKKEFLEQLPDNAVADDFYPLLVVMSQKKRVLYIDEAKVTEVRLKSTNDEFSRRIRASASAMKALMYKNELLLPVYGWISYFLFCHKILRWLTPVFLFVILIFTPFIENPCLLILIVSIQFYLYFGGLLGYLMERMKINNVLFKIPLYAVTMNIGFIGAILRFFSGKDNSKWHRM